jgi:hypothetical protein
VGELTPAGRGEVGSGIGRGKLDSACANVFIEVTEDDAVGVAVLEVSHGGGDVKTSGDAGFRYCEPTSLLADPVTERSRTRHFTTDNKVHTSIPENGLQKPIERPSHLLLAFLGIRHLD